MLAILQAVGVPAPTMINGVPQKAVEGTSLVYTFDDAKAPSTPQPESSRSCQVRHTTAA
jgi:hypothetical protein